MFRSSAAGFGLANGDGATHPLNILQVVDCRLLVGFAAEVHKSETTLAARLPVEGQGALAHFAVLTEQMNEILPLSVPGEISDKDRQKKNLSRLLTFAHSGQMPCLQRGWLIDGIKDYQTILFKPEFDRKPLLQAQ